MLLLWTIPALAAALAAAAFLLASTFSGVFVGVAIRRPVVSSARRKFEEADCSALAVWFSPEIVEARLFACAV